MVILLPIVSVGLGVCCFALLCALGLDWLYVVIAGVCSLACLVFGGVGF